MQVERHIFGSHRGYATLARSPAVTDEDCRILETAVHTFGHTYDLAFGQRLLTDPAFFTSNFADSRRGLTCVAPGQNDETGRPTLQFTTAILSRRDWDTRLMGDPSVLLQRPELWAWDGRPTLWALELPNDPSPAILSRQRVQRALILISELESAIRHRRPLIICEDDFETEDLRAVEMLIPADARDRITTACRCLSPEMPCTLICLAREAGEATTTYRHRDGVCLSDYARKLQENAIASGVVPTAFVLAYKGFGEEPPTPAPIPSPPPGKARRWWRFW